MQNAVNFGAYYRNNQNAWMTEIIWNEWLLKIDKLFRERNRKILLFVDNFSAHLNPPHVTYIKIVFFPANTTSKLQPLDQGIIYSCKTIYKSTMIDKMIQCIDDEIELVPMNIKLAIDLILRCWKNVSLTCIRNCFRKAGFNEDILESEEVIQVPERAITILKERGIVGNEF